MLFIWNITLSKLSTSCVFCWPSNYSYILYVHILHISVYSWNTGTGVSCEYTIHVAGAVSSVSIFIFNPYLHRKNIFAKDCNLDGVNLMSFWAQDIHKTTFYIVIIWPKILFQFLIAFRQSGRFLWRLKVEDHPISTQVLLPPLSVRILNLMSPHTPF